MSVMPRSLAKAARPDRATLLAFGLVVLSGGSNAVAVRFSNLGLPPFWGAGLRFGLASLVFWVVVAARRTPIPAGRSLLGATLYGALAIGAAYAFLYWSLTMVQASLTMVVLAIVPLLTLLFAAAHRLEPFRWRGLIGALIAFAGIAVSVWHDLGGAVPLPALAGLIAGSACIAEASVVVKMFPGADPVATNAVALATGAGILVPLSAIAGEAWALPSDPLTWAAFGYLILIGSILLFYLYLVVLQRWTASATSYSFLLFPVVTVLVASGLAGEVISPYFLAGMGFVLTGVWLGVFASN